MDILVPAFCALAATTMLAVAMKLAGILSWSWWWIIAPPLCVLVGIVWLLRRYR